MDATSGAARPRAEVAHFEIYLRGQQDVHWRLLSANNRDSGQSGSGFPDFDACRSAIDRLLGIITDLHPLYTLAPDHRWNWRLALNEEVLARSSRSFDRRLRCVAASQWFLRAAPKATVRTALRISRVLAPDEATADIRQPFTPVPGQLHHPDLALPAQAKATFGRLADRDIARSGRTGKLSARDRDQEGG